MPRGLGVKPQMDCFRFLHPLRTDSRFHFPFCPQGVIFHRWHRLECRNLQRKKGYHHRYQRGFSFLQLAQFPVRRQGHRSWFPLQTGLLLVFETFSNQRFLMILGG